MAEPTDPRVQEALAKLRSDIFDLTGPFGNAPDGWRNDQEFAKSLKSSLQSYLGDGWEVYGAHIKDGNITFGVRPVLIEVTLTVSREDSGG